MAEKVQVNADKLKVLNAVMEKIEKDFGKGSIMRMNSQEVSDVPVIPTGSITLDIALGVGGYPKGRVVEIYGPESSGKTTLAIHAIAEAQKAGGIAAFIDAEHAFDSFYAQKLGVDVDNLLISQPDNGEQALEIADSLIRSSAIDIIVIDSVAALTHKAEIEGEMGDSKMGLQARLMSQALRKLTSSISKTKTVCIFINQLRDKIGVVYGNPETTTGGNALKFYASVRMLCRRSAILMRMTRTSSERVSSTLRKYSACSEVSALKTPDILVSPSTIEAILGPKMRSMSSTEYSVSSTTSCSRAATTDFTPSPISSMTILATAIGCRRYGSPERRLTP